MRWMLVLLVCLLELEAHAQEPENRIRLEAGFTARTTIFYLKGLRGRQSGPLINATAPYSYKSGIIGTGVTVGFSYALLPKLGIRLTETTTIRYDFYEYEEPDDYIKTFYFDQSLLLTKSIFSRIYLGLGYTWFNLGKELRYTNDNKELTLQLHFNSIDVLLGFPVWKIYFEPKISIVSEDFPGSVKDNATLIGTRIYYTFDL